MSCHWGQMQILLSLQSWNLLLPEQLNTPIYIYIYQFFSLDIVSLWIKRNEQLQSYSFRLLRLPSQSQWGFAHSQSLHSSFFAAFWPVWCCQERWLRLLTSIQPGWLVLNACWGLDTWRHSQQNVFYGQMQPRSKENTSMKDCRSSLCSFSAITIEHLGIWTHRSATNWKLQRCHLRVLQSWSMTGSDSSNGSECREQQWGTTFSMFFFLLINWSWAALAGAWRPSESLGLHSTDSTGSEN